MTPIHRAAEVNEHMPRHGGSHRAFTRIGIMGAYLLLRIVMENVYSGLTPVVEVSPSTMSAYATLSMVYLDS